MLLNNFYIEIIINYVIMNEYKNKTQDNYFYFILNFFF